MTATALDQAYSIYAADPTPQNKAAVVEHLAPTIHYGLASYGLDGDPLMRTKALSFAADAVEKFDPKHGASLPTFLSHQLRQLGRASRQLRSPVRIPDRVQTDAYGLHKATQAFVDRHGREPDTLELADATGMSVKRIEHVRTYQRPVPSEADLAAVSGEEPDFDREAADYVYHDSDHLDRKIMEGKMGYAGYSPMTPAQLALKLKLTPSQLSRRSARLALRISQIANVLKSS